MEAILSRAGVLERVTFLGQLDPEETAREMLQCDLFCLPCKVGPDGDIDSIPHPVEEAMAARMPIVSTHHAGIAELVVDEVSGYLVPEGEFGMIADRLLRLLKEPDRWDAMGREGRARIEAEFSLESVTRRLDEELYQPLLGTVAVQEEATIQTVREAVTVASPDCPGGVRKPLISVVIPAYNGARYLPLTLESVRGQTVENWELVVVDDGSTDGTAEVVEKYSERDSRIRLVRQPNVGVAGARNRGFSESRPDTPYVIFLDQDDIWERDALERLLRALEESPEAVAAHGLSRYIDEEGEPCDPGELEIWGRRRMGIRGRRLVEWPVEAPTTLAVLAYRNCIATTGQTLILRAALAAVGPYDPDTTPCEDWDMTVRLSQLGPLAYVDRVLLSKRKHEGTITGSREMHGTVLEKARYVKSKLLQSERLVGKQRQIARAAVAAWSRHTCAERMALAKTNLANGELRGAATLFRHYLAGQVCRLRRLPA